MLDQALGELFQTIKDKGLWDNTMIVLHPIKAVCWPNMDCMIKVRMPMMD